MTQAAYVATFMVTKTVDTNDGTCDADCSLREAIIAANANPGTDIISLPSGTYMLTIPGTNEDVAATGDLDITDNLIINGASTATIVDGSSIDRVLHVTSSISVTINSITIRNGNPGIGNAGGGIYINPGSSLHITDSNISDNLTASGNCGGGIYNLGDLTVAYTTINNNTASTGGGICNLGTLTVTNSIIRDNIYVSTFFSGGGGGIHNSGVATVTTSTISGNDTIGGVSNKGTLTLINSTVSGNDAIGSGGGIQNSGFTLNGVPVTATLNLDNITITNNTADSDNNGFGDGGGVYSGEFSIVKVKNTILAGNEDMGTQAPDCSGELDSQGYNLIGNGTGCTFTSTTGDQIGTNGSPIDPLLGLLQNNGGPTFTHALLSNSPAIDAGSPNGCTDNLGSLITTDQRGTIRPRGVSCDIGAYELGATLNINYTSGSPGSFFTVTGFDFPANSSATITVNNQTLGIVPTDAGGSFTFLLSTTNADEGSYFVSASTNPIATIGFVLGLNEPIRSQEGSDTIFDVPAGIAFTESIFLPTVFRQ